MFSTLEAILTLTYKKTSSMHPILKRYFYCQNYAGNEFDVVQGCMVNVSSISAFCDLQFIAISEA